MQPCLDVSCGVFGSRETTKFGIISLLQNWRAVREAATTSGIVT
jgi:hypothetical protein